MDNTEEIQKLVGKLVIDSYFANLQHQKQTKDLMKEITNLKERLILTQEPPDGESQ